MMMLTCPVLTMMIPTVTVMITITFQEIMAKGVGFWVVVMIILTSVLTREHFLGEYHHKANDFMRILGFKISDIININDEEAQPKRIIVIKKSNDHDNVYDKHDDNDDYSDGDYDVDFDDGNDDDCDDCNKVSVLWEH